MRLNRMYEVVDSRVDGLPLTFGLLQRATGGLHLWRHGTQQPLFIELSGEDGELVDDEASGIIEVLHPNGTLRFLEISESSAEEIQAVFDDAPAFNGSTEAVQTYLREKVAA